MHARFHQRVNDASRNEKSHAQQQVITDQLLRHRQRWFTSECPDCGFPTGGLGADYCSPPTKSTELFPPYGLGAWSGADGSVTHAPSTTSRYSYRPGGSASSFIHWPFSRRSIGVTPGRHSLKVPATHTACACSCWNSILTACGCILFPFFAFMRLFLLPVIVCVVKRAVATFTRPTTVAHCTRELHCHGQTPSESPIRLRYLLCSSQRWTIPYKKDFAKERGDQKSV